MSVQGVVDNGTGPKRFDFIAGHGFHLLVAAELLPELKRSGMAAALRAAGVAIVGLANQPGTNGTVVDVNGTYQHWFTEEGWVAVAVRPDFYVYGTAVDASSARALADDLLDALATDMSMPERLIKTRW